MRQYFEEQLKIRNPIDEERRIKGKTIYSDYQLGDKLLYFLEMEMSEKPPKPVPFSSVEKTKPEPTMNLILKIVAERELDLLAKDFTYVTTQRNFPLLERRVKHEMDQDEVE